MNNQENPIIQRIIDDITVRYSDNLIAIYGIGSFFDNSLPLNWVKNDIDLIAIVKSKEEIPTQDWTDIPYKKKQMDGYQVWIGFNTIQGYQNAKRFRNESFANYEWSLIELKHPENSKLLYGKDIRDQLPSTNNLEFNYDDILARGLYHINKSLSLRNPKIAKKELSKAIFKTGFYFCIFLDSTYRKTSILEIGNYLKKLEKEGVNLDEMIRYFQEALIFRVSGEFKSSFKDLQNNFIQYLFKLLQNGTLHSKMEFQQLIDYLTNYFNGFPHLIQKLKKKFEFLRNTK
ncbi:MAG: hypothetical protein ACFE9Z_16690 [Promethearchaeota archaeon]